MKKRSFAIGVAALVAALLVAAQPAEGRGWRWPFSQWHSFSHHSLESPERILHPLPVSMEWILRSIPDATEVVADPFDPAHACWRMRDSRQQEVADLVEALEKSGADHQRIERAKDAYLALRNREEGLGPALDQAFQFLHAGVWRRAQREPAPEQEEPPKELPIELPEDDLAFLPLEFRLYFEGAAAYWSGDLPAARARWHRLLQLPAEQRPYRTTWATWMLAKTEPTMEDALVRFRQTLASANAGFSDSLRLAVAAERWIAEADPKRESREATIRLHFRRAIRGNSSSLTHFRWAVPGTDQMPPGSELEKEMLSTRLSRLAVLAEWAGTHSHVHERREFHDDYRLDRPEQQSLERWLYLVADYRKTPGERALLATIAYRLGNLALTHDLLFGTRGLPDADWLRAKLAIHKKQPQRALRYLERARPHFEQLRRIEHPRALNPEVRWIGMDRLEELKRDQFFTDLGVIRLAVDDYPGAAEAFVAANNRFAAVHVLQNLLSQDELLAFVRTHFPGPTPESDFRDPFAGEVARYVRRAAGAKLAVRGAYQQAMEFLDREDRSRLDLYLKMLAIARDEKMPAAERAEAMWRAAQMRRIFRSLFAVLEPPKTRLPTGLWPAMWRLDAPWPACLGEAEPAPDRAFLSPTEEEFHRLRAHGPLPEYIGFPRYDAAKHAREASDLAGSNSEAGARYLCDGASWVKFSNPVYANQFYRELLRTHPDTDLGKQAKTKNWFPRTPWPTYPLKDPAFTELLREHRIGDVW